MNRFRGEIITKGAEKYEEARMIWNRGINLYPKGIIYCDNVYDVCTAINFVQKCRDDFRIATGSHNSCGFCTCDDGYVINTSRLQFCNPNVENGVLNVGCGMTECGLCNLLQCDGIVFPGPDANKCIGPWCLGGGIGSCCRTFGLGCDRLIEAQIVNYRGDIILANQYCNPDLFWAIRGGGCGNFGIATAFTFQTNMSYTSITYFEIRISSCGRSTMIEFFELWEESILCMKEEFNIQVEINNSFHQGRYIYSYGYSYRSVEETKNFLGAFGHLKGVQIICEEKSYSGIIQEKERIYPPYEYCINAGRFSYDMYPKQEIEKIIDIIYNTRAEGAIFTSLQLSALGGNIQHYRSKDTAFYHRNARFLMSLKTQWFHESYKQYNEVWFEKKHDYLSSITTGSYIRQPYKGLKDFESEYYGDNMWDLRNIKAKYDPNNFFHYPQSIQI